MNLIWLEDFLALAASGNFSRAAEDRNSSQPAFSRRIRALEEWLGVELFDRSSQPARLTEAGRWLIEVAQETLERVARLPGDARKVAQMRADTLRIAATHALSFTFLPHWLHSRAAAAPVQLMSDSLARCEAMMLQSKVQFLLCHAHPQMADPLAQSHFDSVRVGSDVLVLAAQADARGQPRIPLLGHPEPVPLLDYSEDSGLGRILHHVIGRRLAAVPRRTVFTAPLASALRSMVLEGRGIGWLPLSLVQEDLQQGRLARAADTDWDVPVDIRLYRDRQPLAEAAEAFWALATQGSADSLA